MSFAVYQGGIPSLYTRHGLRQQRGSGFLSGLKRFLLPLARRALPHVAGAVSDIVAGKEPVVDILKTRGRAAGADLIESAGRQASNALRQGIKRSSAPANATPPKKRRQKRPRVKLSKWS